MVGSLFIGDFKTEEWGFKAWVEEKLEPRMMSYRKQLRALKQRSLGVGMSGSYLVLRLAMCLF